MSELPKAPPPPDQPYLVDDAFGSYIEVMAAGATEGALELAPGDRAMIVAEDEWDADHTHRIIRRVSAISLR